MKKVEGNMGGEMDFIRGLGFDDVVPQELFACPAWANRLEDACTISFVSYMSLALDMVKRCVDEGY